MLDATLSIYAQNQIQTNGFIWDLAWNSDATMLAVAHTGTIEILDCDGQSHASLEVSAEQIFSVAWSPTEPNVLAFGTEHGIVKIIAIDDSGYEVLFEIPPAQDRSQEVNYLQAVAWNADGTRLAVSGSRDIGPDHGSAVRVWDIENSRLTATYRSGYSVTDMAWHPLESDSLLITGIWEDVGTEIALWMPEADSISWKTEQEVAPVYLAWSADGSQFASTTSQIGGVSVQLRDALSGAIEQTLNTDITSMNANISWSPGNYLAVSGFNENTSNGIVEVLDMDTNRVIKTVDLSTSLALLTWSPLGQLTLGFEQGIIELDAFGVD